uniref:glycosyltransferase n=1 Tax=Loktanella sp. M215 TaxID=2675431 RepID=UPI001F3CB085|nr:glycosyltransferase [Loktanella sp. M215]MCF7702116.1 hypothetical protein [Loktanella sp. M215]
MLVAGVCRFSLVGRGDWKAYQGKTDAEVEAIATRQADVLFTTERMTARLLTFEHLTLASIKAQTDQDFIFMVLASNLMPKRFRERLENLCNDIPQVKLQFFGLTSASDAQKKMFRENELDFGKVLQFRLDDDDCLCADYIALMKSHTAHLMAQDKEPFAATIHGVMYTKVMGPDTAIYNWPVNFFSAGAAVRHQSKSIYDFGHFALENRFRSVSIAGRISLVTNNGTNDTDYNSDMLRKRKMSVMTQEQVEIAVERNFKFLEGQGKKLSGIADFLEKPPIDDVVKASEVVSRGGIFISHETFFLTYVPRSADDLVVSTSYTTGPSEKERMTGGMFADNCRRLGVSSLDIVLRGDDDSARSSIMTHLGNMMNDGLFASFPRTLILGGAEGAHLATAVAGHFPDAPVLLISPRIATALPVPLNSEKNRIIVISDPKHVDTDFFDKCGDDRPVILNARRSGPHPTRFLDFIGVLDKMILEALSGKIDAASFYRTYRIARSNRRYQADLMNDIIVKNSMLCMKTAYSYFKKIDRHGLASELLKHLDRINAASEHAESDGFNG